MAGTPSRALTHRQTMFKQHYMTNGQNATQAAIDAGYSKKTARNMGSKLLNHPLIKELIERDQNQLIQIFDITKEAIAQEHATIAFATPVGSPSFADKRGSLDSISKMFGYTVDKHEVSHELTYEGFKKQFEAMPE